MTDENNLTREQIIRRDLSIDQVIWWIREKYNAEYDPNSTFDAWDQLLVCEAIAEATLIQDKNQEESMANNSLVNGLVIGTRKFIVNWELTQRKKDIVSLIRKCTSKTKPPIITVLLNEFFTGCGTKNGWWFKVSQDYCPREIGRNLASLIKRIENGWETIENPAAYFTNTIKYRAKRKIPKPNGTRKPQCELGGEVV